MSPRLYSLLLLALVPFIQACGPRLTKPVPKPMPVTIDCEQRLTAEVPPIPDPWFLLGPEWANEVLGILRDERNLRASEHECLAKLRKSGVIQ